MACLLYVTEALSADIAQSSIAELESSLYGVGYMGPSRHLAQPLWDFVYRKGEGTRMRTAARCINSRADLLAGY